MVHGIIKSKIEKIYKNILPERDMKELATLIYYPEEKLQLIKNENSKKELEEWYRINLYRLIEVSREVSSKYTRSKVRKALPDGFDYIIDELLHLQGEGVDKAQYYSQIVDSIIELDGADSFIVALSNLIKRMAIDHLHIVGDIYNRGPGAVIIMDKLMEFHSLDIQWGNHDALWMGAASGNEACICNVIRICSRYDNMSTLEEGYGINTRPLSMFALEMYKNDDCKKFFPKSNETESKYCNSDKIVMAKIQKAISIIQFKIEGELIKKHPEYKMEDRLLLDKIDYKKKTIIINGKKYELNDKNFPTIDPANPYKLTVEEKEVMQRIKEAFLHSEKLQKHVTFLYAKGNLYKKYNDNILFHGCIPLTQTGELEEVEVFSKKYKGKNLMEKIESIMHVAYFGKNDIKNQFEIDYMWYLWCGPKSPLFGRSKMATFERYFIDDKSVHIEGKNPYYKFMDDENVCDKILENFEISANEGHIINGHVPVKVKDGESPIHSNGKMILIDGGFSKAYQPTTGIAGYSLSYNSNGLVLAVNEPFTSKAQAVKDGSDIKSEIILKENVENKKMVGDTDIGLKLKEEISDLKELLMAYKNGSIKEIL
jgi:fructose-1,6-bisphosphatase-3